MILEKILSGRFILTIIVGIIFLKTCWVDPSNVEKYSELFYVVIYAYFNRLDRKGGPQ